MAGLKVYYDREGKTLTVLSCLPAGRSVRVVDESVVWHAYIARGLGGVEIKLDNFKLVY